MEIERLQDLSILYFLKGVIDDVGGDPDCVVLGFPTAAIALPTVAIEGSDITSKSFELGNRKGLDVRIWFIDIFAKNMSQRDEYAYLIKKKLLEGVPVLDYDEGFPPEVTDQTQLGSMSVDETSTTAIRVFAELVSDLYWRREVKATASYNKAPE